MPACSHAVCHPVFTDKILCQFRFRHIGIGRKRFPSTVVGGDVAVWFGELDEPHTEGQLRVRALGPELVWLAHTHEPWRPRTV